MVDVAVQLYTNRRCAGERAPVRVDGEVGDNTLTQLRRCAQEGYPGFDAIVAALTAPGARQDLATLEARIADVVAGESAPR
jgi:hypothetical protein